jgi:hypothetical protein
MVTQKQLNDALENADKIAKEELKQALYVIKTLTARIDELAIRIDLQDIEIKSLKDSKISEKPLLSKLVEQVGKPGTLANVAVVSALNKHNKDVTNREKRIVVFGLPESVKTQPSEITKDDTAEFKNVMASLSKSVNIVRIERFKKKKEL